MLSGGRLDLNDITLVCVDTVYWGKSLDSLYWSLNQCKFGDAILFTHQEFYDRGDKGEYGDNYKEKMKSMGLRTILIDYLIGKNGYKSYSWFMLKELYKHIKTKFLLVTQADGWVINIDSWEDEFYNYDYIGSRWHFYNDGMDVGNGGFSLRSRKLHSIIGEGSNFDGGAWAEDTTICRSYRKFLEVMHDVKYAPGEIADKFTYDHAPFKGNQFGFHCVDTKGYELGSASKYGRFADWSSEINPLPAPEIKKIKEPTSKSMIPLL